MPDSIIPNVVISMPSQLFTLARSFKAASNGKIYIGKIDTDPTIPSNQIQVYIENEDGSHVPTAQPISINMAGYPVYGGQITKFVTVEGHSMAVYDAYGAQQFYFPNILKYDPDQFSLLLSGEGGAALVGTSNGMNVQERLDRSVIYMDDIFPAKDGSVDCAAALNAAIQGANTNKQITKFLGTRGSVYRFDDTISLVGVENIELDFAWATVNDNVQGVIPESGNRPKHTFHVYNGGNIALRNINVNVLSTRSAPTNPDTPLLMFCVGTNYDDDNYETNNIYLENVSCKNTISNTMVVAVLGESHDGYIRNFHIEGDAAFGINLEYGDIPVNPDIDPTWNNGKHPYNWIIDTFNGFGLINCRGFLRVASCFNIQFTNCVGYNVKSFIYGYCGDRNISRVSQSVRFVNCKNKIDESVLSAANNAVTILVPNKDGSTGSDLPSWTNYIQLFSFDNCEFWNNTASGSSCVRFFGNKGKTSFTNCLFKKSYRGINALPSSSNPTYVTDNGLKIERCVFESNYQDIYLANTVGTIIDSCSFRSQQVTSTISQIEIDGGGIKTKIISCDFKGQSVNRPYITTSTISAGTFIEKCDFNLASVGYSAIFIASRSSGYGNTSNGNLILRSNMSCNKLTGQPETELRDIVTGGTLDYNVMSNATASTAISAALTSLINGVLGSIFTINITSSAGSLTIVNAASGVATGDRFVTLTGSNKTMTGRSSARFIKLDSGWYEM